MAAQNCPINAAAKNHLINVGSRNSPSIKMTDLGSINYNRNGRWYNDKEMPKGCPVTVVGLTLPTMFII